MKRIKVVSGVLAVSQGATLDLSDEQARSRRHNLDPATGEGGAALPGRFVARVPLQFRAGEELGVSEIAKGQLDQVEILDPADEGRGEDRRSRRRG